MDIRPIFSTLRRHKTAAALIVVEIALSCAIICNALFLIDTRVDRMQRVSGLAEDQIVRVEVCREHADAILVRGGFAQTPFELASRHAARIILAVR